MAIHNLLTYLLSPSFNRIRSREPPWLTYVAQKKKPTVFNLKSSALVTGNRKQTINGETQKRSTCESSSTVQLTNTDINKVIVDDGLCSRCATHDEYLLVFIVEQNLVGILAVMLVVFYRHLGKQVTRHKATMLKHTSSKNRKYITYIATSPESTCIKIW